MVLATSVSYGEVVGQEVGTGRVGAPQNEITTDNRQENLELLSPFEHMSLHTKGRKRSEETKAKIRKSNILFASDPEERKRRSERGKKQYAANPQRYSDLATIQHAEGKGMGSEETRAKLKSADMN